MSLISKNDKENMHLSNKIGILMKLPESNFSNGCVQQGIFIKQLLENLGFSCDYISIEKQYKRIHDIGDFVVFMDANTDLSKYHTFIFVSLNLASTENHDIIENIKTHGIVCVNVICGNLYILHQEEFVFGHHNIIEKFINSFYDEYWVLEMYSFMTEYIQLLTCKPTYLLPYVWNDTILNSYITNHKLQFDIDYHSVNRSKINILIFEPNMSIHKTCLVPLLIAENYNKLYKDKLNKVYVFCGTEVIKKRNTAFLKSLSLYSDNKIECYNRIVMPSIIALIRRSNTYINVVVSHNIMNPLNFLHLELLTINIPFIHNCKPFIENGLYYDDHSTCSAVDLVEYVRTNFFLNSKYLTNKYKIHKEFHPNNFERQQVYKTHIERITGIYTDNTSKLGPAIHIVDIFKRTCKFIMNNKIEKSLFYNGMGIILFIHEFNQLPLLKITLNSLNMCKNLLRVEVIYNGDIIDISGLSHMALGYNIDFLNISNEFGKLEEKPNMYMSCVFSTFIKGIYVECGSVFVESPELLIKKYVNDTYNSISFFPSHTRIKHMSKLDQDVHFELAKYITPFPVCTTDFISGNKILFFNKEDDKAVKVLGTMCELYKINQHMVNNINILSLVCELNYENDKSKINIDQNIIGQTESTFKGHIVYFEKSIMLYYKQLSPEICITKAMIDITHNDIHIVLENNKFVFKGKYNGKKIPKNILEILK